MILLSRLVDVSSRISSTTKKKEKISLFAGLLREAKGREILLTSSYLSGQLPQGRLGIGWAGLQEALEGLTGESRPIGLVDLDRSFEAIAAERGPGSSERKRTLLRETLSHAGERERDFLVRT